MIFEYVLSKVVAGDILDLGCGQAGLYWSMSYASRARSISLFDYSTSNLKEINRQLSVLSPEFIEEKFEGTYQFLREENLIAQEDTSAELASHVLEKVDLVKEFDFRVLTTTRKFDSIVSIEAIECVSSLTELDSVLTACAEMLKPQGQLVGIMAKYDQFTERTQELIDMRFAGALNPDEAVVRDAFIKSGFEIEELRTVPTPELHNYGEAIIFDAYKR